MSASKKIKELQKLLLEQLGKNPDNYIEIPEADNERSRDERKFSAEATLRSLQWPNSTKVSRECKECGFMFLTEYHSVAYCSNLCRKSKLSKYGIDWSDKPLKHSYGGMTPPGIIPPDALEAMADILRQAKYTVLSPQGVEVALPEPEERTYPKELSQTQMPYETPKQQEIKPPAVILYEDDFGLL